jgi:hypothetical protein
MINDGKPSDSEGIRNERCSVVCVGVAEFNNVDERPDSAIDLK